MPIKIDIPGGGTDTSDATASASDILSGKTAYVNDQKITGTISLKTSQLYTPGTTNQTIASGQYLAGTQTIKGDSNLKSANIKSGISIFGIPGSLDGIEVYSDSFSINNSYNMYPTTYTLNCTTFFPNSNYFRFVESKRSYNQYPNYYGSTNHIFEWSNSFSTSGISYHRTVTLSHECHMILDVKIDGIDFPVDLEGGNGIVNGEIKYYDGTEYEASGVCFEVFNTANRDDESNACFYIIKQDSTKVYIYDNLYDTKKSCNCTIYYI